MVNLLKPIELEELELTNLKHEVKVPELKRTQISTFIFADKNVSTEQISKIIERQRGINNRKIFLVGKLQEDSNQLTELSFLLIGKEFNLPEGYSLEEWIYKQSAQWM